MKKKLSVVSALIVGCMASSWLFCAAQAERALYSYVLEKIPASIEKNEDRCAVGLRSEQDHVFFGVYDGHGGVETAECLKAELHEHVFSAVQSGVTREAITEAFLQTDRLILEQSSLRRCAVDKSGSTATALLLDVDKRMFHVAWVGDSPAFLVSSAGVFELLTDPLHSPRDELERQRIEAAGGSVQKGRVQGLLNMSRSFGDAHLKDGGVIAEPYVVSMPMKDGDCVVLMSDGVSNIIPTAEVANLVHLARDNISYICEVIAQSARRGWEIKYEGRHTPDDITLMIVKFGKPDEPQPD